MRLSEVLSRPPTTEYTQVDRFMDKRLGFGKQRKLNVGCICRPYRCSNCNDTMTFISNEKLFCIGIDSRSISIDAVLRCSRPKCTSMMQMWFLVEGEGIINGPSPKVRIIKHSEKLSDTVFVTTERFGIFTQLLEKAERAYRDGLGAGALVYLRKIYETITVQAAIAAEISLLHDNGKKKPFRYLLEEVDTVKRIIPSEFSRNGYRLFGELSEVVHGEYDEALGLQKYKPLRRLVVGIIENIKNNSELNSAIATLGWTEDNSNE